jgi:uncharacterized protein (TIGR00725 family)
LEAQLKINLSGPKIGVMGSANYDLSQAEREKLALTAEHLGRVIADKNCVVITGGTTGLPDLVSRSARRAGAVAIGISPAIDHKEHISKYGLPDDGVDLLIYTGFGLKGRNVVNIRASDIVIIFGGGMGTLNEFTIAYDEGKVIGVLVGSGGIADHIEEIVTIARKRTSAEIVSDTDVNALIDRCLAVFNRRHLAP